jgi:hypothetical protein
MNVSNKLTNPFWPSLTSILLLFFSFLICGCSNNTPPSFTGSIDSEKRTIALTEFIDHYRGKVVHINVDIATAFSNICKTTYGPVQLTLRFKPCLDANARCTDCDLSNCVIRGNDYELGWYKGVNRFNGYFVVDENVELHGGECYGLKAVPSEQVLLRKPL